MAFKIIDSTLREGRQSIFFNTILRVQDDYVDSISKMGIEDIEYRNPSVNTEELEIYKRLKNKYPNIRFHVHIYLSKSNIDWVINEPDVEYVSTFIKFPLSETSVTDMQYLLHGTQKKIRVAIENAPNASAEELEIFVGLLRNEEVVDRVAFSDTLGIFTPEKIKLFLNKINTIGLGGKAMEFHLHNDYGLAAANALQILIETERFPRVVYFSTSMFGIGERNGILSYGDLFANIIRLKIPQALNLEVYGELVELMEKNDIYFNRDPLCRTSFSHFASSHILGELGDTAYHSISPADIGMKSRYIFNNLTGQNVFNRVAQTLLGQVVPENEYALRDYVLKEMREQNKDLLYLEEVANVLCTFYKNRP